MTRRRNIIIGAAVVALAAAGTAVALAESGDDDATERPIPAASLEQASAAALDHTGGGEVTGTEAGDEESYYEVEVTLPNGSQTDVQLDQSFDVVGDEVDDGEADEGEE